MYPVASVRVAKGSTVFVHDLFLTDAKLRRVQSSGHSRPSGRESTDQGSLSKHLQRDHAEAARRSLHCDDVSIASSITSSSDDGVDQSGLANASCVDAHGSATSEDPSVPLLGHSPQTQCMPHTRAHGAAASFSPLPSPCKVRFCPRVRVRSAKPKACQHQPLSDDDSEEEQVDPTSATDGSYLWSSGDDDEWSQRRRRQSAAARAAQFQAETTSTATAITIHSTSSPPSSASSVSVSLHTSTPPHSWLFALADGREMTSDENDDFEPDDPSSALVSSSWPGETRHRRRRRRCGGGGHLTPRDPVIEQLSAHAARHRAECWAAHQDALRQTNKQTQGSRPMVTRRSLSMDSGLTVTHATGMVDDRGEPVVWSHDHDQHHRHHRRRPERTISGTQLPPLPPMPPGSGILVNKYRRGDRSYRTPYFPRHLDYYTTDEEDVDWGGGWSEKLSSARWWAWKAARVWREVLGLICCARLCEREQDPEERRLLYDGED